VVDRRFNRRRADAAKTIQAFSTRLRDQIDLDTLSTELLAVVDQTMQPTQVEAQRRERLPRFVGGYRGIEFLGHGRADVVQGAAPRRGDEFGCLQVEVSRLTGAGAIAPAQPGVLATSTSTCTRSAATTVRSRTERRPPGTRLPACA
jgi:hypothetical protein